MDSNFLVIEGEANKKRRKIFSFRVLILPENHFFHFVIDKVGIFEMDTGDLLHNLSGFSRKPGYKSRSALEILFISRFYTHTLFEQSDTRYLEKHKGHQDGTKYGPPSACRQGKQIIPPPLRGVAKVIGVAGVTPNSCAQYLALVRRIGDKSRQLPVAYRFEKEANNPNYQCNKIEQG
jgi:hypothetical protein